MDVLARIDELRKEKGWSVSRKTEPKISTLRAICEALGISLSDFFKEDVSPDDELVRKVKALSEENKAALLQLINHIK